MFSKKIYVKGYYGYKNLGDDVFTVTAEWIFNEYFEGISPIFIGKNLPQLKNSSIKFEPQNSVVKKILEFFIFLNTKYLLYFGGSLFTDGGQKFGDLRYLIRTLPFLNKKIFTIGTSIGPFENIDNYKSTQNLLSKFEMIGVRDYSSLDIVKEMNLDNEATFTFDNAILLDRVFPEAFLSSKNTNETFKIGISLCRYESYNNMNIEVEKERESRIKETVDLIISNGNINNLELVFIEFNGNMINGDAEVTNEFYKYYKGRCKARIINYSNNTSKMIKEINDCDFIFGVRLHSGIIAYALGIPFVLVEYHKKCTEFLNTINNQYRFNLSDTNKNVSLIEEIINNGYVPDIISPEYFKTIMLDELNQMRNKF